MRSRRLVLAAVDRLAAAHLDAQVDDLVAQLVELAFEARGFGGIRGSQARDVAARVEHAVLQPLDVGRRDGALGSGRLPRAERDEQGGGQRRGPEMSEHR